ncbi:MAG: sorbosone dehydrogenase [Rhodospirillaceae bacterium]|jgi:glucose/arabinose dehydrogenase|nr:sorbosone dehydrogenase [Rhodospirillaceae bacterium]MBT5658761.1 sorbosone dehydrogenase [Rhodospirillaceae bacterium]MBT5752948.1 sorbosone dehydrogenase [Rhodospirillaceae bacterium]
MKLPFFLALYALFFSILAAPAAFCASNTPPGTQFHLLPENLPKPFASPSVSNPPRHAQPRPNTQLKAPEGFAVNLFADGLEDARWLAVAPNGDVFLAQSDLGRITLLRDTNDDGRADFVGVYGDEFDRPHGLAFNDGWLYIADTRRVWRLPYKPGSDTPGTRPEPVTRQGAIGDGSGHWTRNIAFHPDGTRFYVSVGSRRNIDVESPPRASVQEFSKNGKSQHSFATGLRNPVGIAFYPGSDDLYVVVNERDGLGDGLVPDYLTGLKDGGFYGWPYAYIGPNPQPKFAGRRPDLVKKTLTPDLLFHSHSAPLGLAFYNHDSFGEAWRGDAFVALHGSWNAAVPQGYMVVRVPFENGQPAGGYEAFLTGFWIEGEETAGVWGRPAGLAVAADGSLLVADDLGGKIWRVSRKP